MIRHMPIVAPHWIYKPSIRGINYFLTFDNFQFDRSNDMVQDFQCTSNPNMSLIICHIGRFLQVYELMTARLLFKFAVPELSMCKQFKSLGQTFQDRTIFCLDNDQLIMVRDGNSKVLFISLQQQTQVYKKKLKIARPDDAKILIDIIKPGNEVDIGFKRLEIEEDKFSSDSQKD